MNLGLSGIAVFEDCNATALTTQPPRINTNQIYDVIFHFQIEKAPVMDVNMNMKEVKQFLHAE